MTDETILPELVGTLAALPENTQKTIKAYGAACYRTALQSSEVQRLKAIETAAGKVLSLLREDEYIVLTVHLDALRAAMEQQT